MIFKVTAESVSYYDIEVEAETEAEAMEIAGGKDGSEFSNREPEDFGSWDLISAVKI